MSYDNNMTGVLFKNDKQGNESRPDYTGDITIDGKKYRLASWLKEGKKGKFLSLRVSELEAKPGEKAAQKASKPLPADFEDSEIPF